MPQTVLQVFRGSDGSVPFQEWLDGLEIIEPGAYSKCLASLLRLESLGYELRRPTTGYLRDGIYELRFRVSRVQYRALYFFNGRNVVVLSHGLTKESKVPERDIDRAVKRKEMVKNDPDSHTASWEVQQ